MENITYEQIQHFTQAVLDWFEHNNSTADTATISDWVDYLIAGREVPSELAILAARRRR